MRRNTRRNTRKSTRMSTKTIATVPPRPIIDTLIHGNHNIDALRRTTVTGLTHGTTGEMTARIFDLSRPQLLKLIADHRDGRQDRKRWKLDTSLIVRCMKKELKASA